MERRALLLALYLVRLLAAAKLDRGEFPPSFLFGVSTSAYQIEGAVVEDNRSASNWDVFAHQPGSIVDGSNADVADDHYHLYAEDVELMHSLGINAYRFSISWSRILPRIEPFVTLNQGEIPQELEERYGSWLSPQMQEDFVYFAEVCFRAFGNRVKYWVTVNQPNLMLKFSYYFGTNPPSRCSQSVGNCTSGDSMVEPYVAAHNVLLAHAAAADIYKRFYQFEQGGSIGIVINALWFEPLTNSTADYLAVQRAFSFCISWFLDPLFHGDYPHEMRQILASNLPTFSPEERIKLQGKLDFIGINHYSSLYVGDCLSSSCDLSNFEGNALVFSTGERNGSLIGAETAMPGMFVYPLGMERVIAYIKERYNNPPIYITENGYSQRGDGEMKDILNDQERIEFTQAYLTSAVRAIRQGADVRGYFVWSLFDNFEWTYGYTLRFGLFHVDFQTQERTPKHSALWYNTFLRSRTSIQGFKQQPGGVQFM